MIEQLTELWQGAASGGADVYGDSPLRTVRRAVVDRHPPVVGRRRCKQALVDELGDVTFEELPVRFQVCAASIERAAEHWFDSGPVVDAVVASAAVPGLLPPAKVGDEHYLDGGIVNSIPLGRAVQLGAVAGVRAPGRPDRPAADGRRSDRGRSPGCRSRSPAATGSTASWPSCRASVEAHVLPARGTSGKDDSVLGTRDFSGVQERIDLTYEAIAGVPRRAPRAIRPVIWVLRRCVIAPLVVGLAVLAWFTLPLWLIGAAALSPIVPGRLRPLRFFWVVIVYLTCEAVLLVVMFGLWIASGFGWRLRTPYFEGIHYDLVQGTMWVLLPRGPAGAAADASSPRARSARAPRAGRSWSAAGTPGPGDSFVLIHTLMAWYDREPRVVLKDTLAWDPMISVVLNRIPARFITPNPGPGEDLETQIAELATGLDENDAFVIFPEGGNFTPRRRQKAIDRLRRLGMERMAQRAEQMIHVLAPRPGGFLAALDAAPDADVVLVAHTGLDHMVTVGEVWRELPMDKRIIMRWWQIPRAEIPAGREERIEWLFGWWERIDAWIDENRPVDVSTGRS